MGQNARLGQQKYSWITVDWLVVVIATVAIFLLLGTVLRKTIDVHPSLSGAGYQMLGAQDELVAFETFTFAPDDWSVTTIADDLPGLGPVLGPFGNEPVQRSFSIPSGAGVATLRFDLTLLGQWSENDALRIAIGEVEVSAVSLGEGRALAVDTPDLDGITFQSTHRTLTPSAPDMSLGAEAEPLTMVRVQMLIANPDAALTLRLQAAGEGIDGGAATWALDTLSMFTALGDQITP